MGRRNRSTSSSSPDGTDPSSAAASSSSPPPRSAGRRRSSSSAQERNLRSAVKAASSSAVSDALDDVLQPASHKKKGRGRPLPTLAASSSSAAMSVTPSDLAAQLSAIFSRSRDKLQADAAAAASSSSSSSAAPLTLTVEDSRAELSNEEAEPFYQLFTRVAALYSKCYRHYLSKDREKARQESKTTHLLEEEKETIRQTVQTLYDALGYNPQAALAAAAAPASSSSSSSSPSPLRSSSCQSCFTEFTDEETGADACSPVTMHNCGHAQFCADCFRQVVAIKIKEETVMPWLTCPSPDCRHPLTPSDLYSVASLSQLSRLCLIYMRKRLVRNDCFVSCQTSHCLCGFFVRSKSNGKPPKPQTLSCPLCQQEQLVEKGKEGDLDPEFKKMIEEGTLRPCPKCQHLTMKEKGICNVLQCMKCSVWWNWATKETGTSSSVLKQKARMSGTLWQPGELYYQQQLQRTNLPEFIALLRRNGQEYDPNYVRGT